MIDVNELRSGVTFELDGNLYKVLEYSHHKPGRGKATIRTKIRDLRSGGVMEKSFLSGDRVQDIRLDHHMVQFLYQDGDLYYFMDTESFEQTPLTSEQLGDALHYIKEGMTLMISRYGDEAIGVELPITVELLVSETGPSFKGDTSQAGTKPAVLETGVTIQVPYFINTGDMVRVDTRTSSYVERV